MAGQGVVSPILPLYARTFGVSTAVVGLTLTAFGLARLVLNIPAGWWADRAGRRFLLVGGPLVTAVGMVGSGLAPSIGVLLAWRVVAGAGSALYMTGAQIYLIDIAADDQRARYVATNQAALLLGVTMGPAIGGLLADTISLRAPFLVVGAGATLTAVYAFFRLPETARHLTGVPSTPSDADAGPLPDDGTRPATTGAGGGTEAPRAAGSQAPTGTGLDGVRRVLSRQFLAVGAVTFAVFAVRSGYRQTLFPLAAVERFGFTTTELGVLLAVTGIAGLVLITPAGWAADRFGRRPVIIGPGLVTAAGVFVTAAADGVTLFIAGSALAAVGSSITGPAPAAFVADITPAPLRGLAMGVYRTVGDLGLVVAPVAAGLLADLITNQAGMAAIAVTMMVAVGWFSAVAVEPARAGRP